MSGRHDSRVGSRGGIWPGPLPAIRHILGSSSVQAKLTIGDPNDKYEKEADRVAGEVVCMSPDRVDTPPPGTKGL